MKYFKIAIDGTGTMSANRKIHFLRNLLHGEALREFDDLAGQVAGTTNVHLKYIKEGLLRYFSPISTITKQNRDDMCYAKKPRTPFQEIFRTTDGAKQLSTVPTWIKRHQEYGP